MPTTPEEHAAVIDREETKWLALIKKSGPSRNESYAMTCALHLIAASALTVGAASAREYPTRPITLVVPYAAGGGNDVIARIVAER